MNSFVFFSPLNIGQGYVDSPKKMAVFDPNVCQEDGSGNFQVMFKVSLQRAGRYNLTCRRGADRSSTAVLKGIVVVVSDQSSVQSIFPPAIDSCRSKTLILKVRFISIFSFLLYFNPYKYKYIYIYI